MRFIRKLGFYRIEGKGLVPLAKFILEQVGHMYSIFPVSFALSLLQSPLMNSSFLL